MHSSAYSKAHTLSRGANWSPREQSRKEAVGPAALAHVHQEHGTRVRPPTVTAGQGTVPWLPQAGERELGAVRKKGLRENIQMPAKNKN